MSSEFGELADRAQRLNVDIDTNTYLGPQYQIGHTYYCDVVAFAYQFIAGSERRRNRVLFNRSGGALDPVAALWRYSLHPLLEQYLSGIDLAERDTLVRHARSILLESAVRE